MTTTNPRLEPSNTGTSNSQAPTFLPCQPLAHVPFPHPMFSPTYSNVYLSTPTSFHAYTFAHSYLSTPVSSNNHNLPHSQLPKLLSHLPDNLLGLRVVDLPLHYSPLTHQPHHQG